jgi:radical SAM-linked protein
MIDAVRIRFTKVGKVRFVGHRDVARLFERALRKSGVNISYTEGFSPRPKIAFGLALSTGHESLAEYLDIALPEDRDVDVTDLPGRLSPALPPGIDVVAAARVQAGDASLQEAVTSCTWRIEIVDIDVPTADRLVASTIDAPELVLTRIRKGKEVTDDLRPAVLSLAVDGPIEGGGVALLTELATQPRGVRPNELLQVIDASVEAGRVLRIAQWTTREGVRGEPLALREDSSVVRHDTHPLDPARGPAPVLA